MRNWKWLALCGLAFGGPAHSETARAIVAVSATVQDRCIVHAASRSASCSGAAVYAVGVAQEKLVVTDQLTGSSEYAQTSYNEQLAAASGRGTGDASLRVAYSAGGGTPLGASRTIEATRVTYSF